MHISNIIIIVKRLTDYNAKMIKKSEKCFCYMCRASFIPEEIEETDKYSTAYCPVCDYKSIIPDSGLHYAGVDSQWLENNIHLF